MAVVSWLIWQRAQGNQAAGGPTGPTEYDLEQAEILFTVGERPDRNQLYRMALAEREPQPITDASQEIINYALSPDGATLVYSAWREDGGADLWWMSLDGGEAQSLLECPRTLCTHPEWSPDGERLAFVRRELEPEEPVSEEEGVAPLAPEIWLLDWGSREVEPLSESGNLGYGGKWAPNGDYLSFVSPTSAASQVVPLGGGSPISFANGSGIVPTWGPASDALVGVDTGSSLEDGSAAARLIRYDLADESATPILDDVNILDNAFAWSPDGQWIATLRPDRHGESSSLGGQVWLVRPDGSEERQLTEEPDLFRQTLFWSPDGRSLLVTQQQLRKAGAPMEIWLVDIETGETERLAEGSQPLWMPQ